MDIRQSSRPDYQLKQTQRSGTEVSAVKDTAKQTDSPPAKIRNIDLKEGMIIKGRVLDLRYQEVKLSIDPGGQIVTARLSGDVSLSIGQEAQFQVVEGDTRQFVIKLISDDIPLQNDITIQKALTASGLPLNHHNKAIVAELLNHRMPIDRQTLLFMAKLSLANRDISPQTLVLMYKNNIPITKENIRQFEAYQNGTHQMLKDIHNFTKNVSDLFQPASRSQASLSDQAAPSSSNLSDNSSPQNMNHPITNLSFPDAAVKQAVKINHSLINILYPTFKENTAKDNQESFTPQSEMILEKTLGQKLPMAESYGMLSEVLAPEEQELLVSYLKEYPASEVITEKISSGSATLKDLFTFIRDSFLPLTADQHSRQALDLLQSPLYSKLLEKAFLLKWTITPALLAKKQPVQKLYQELQEDFDNISRLMKNDANNYEMHSLKEPVQNMQENLQFVKDLNEVFTYLQLPLQLQNQCTHTDLYVLSRKKSIDCTKEDLNVLLHLEMSQLGSLNVYLQLKPAHMIHTTFYVEDNEASTLIREHLSLLTDTLEEKGYHPITEVKNSYKQPDFVTDFIEQNTPDNNVMRYSFDIRT